MSATITKEAGIESISMSMSLSISGRIEDMEKGLKHLEDNLANFPSGVITRVENRKITYQTKDAGLRDAARNGRLEDVKKYLNDGDVNVDAMDQEGLTALYFACWCGHHDIAETLLDHGADMSALRGSWEGAQSPFHVASAYGHASIVKLFLDRECAVDIKSQISCTALYYACYSRRLKCVEVLLAHGADATIKNVFGTTPFGQAMKKRWPENRQALIQLLTMDAKIRKENHLLSSKANAKTLEKSSWRKAWSVVKRRCFRNKKGR